jgi:hypothetical protein
MQYISTTDTAKLIRAALKESFPGVKFSVKSSSYSGGSSIRVSWTDGPSAAMVESVAGVFKGSYFDGQTDYKGNVYAIVDGKMTSFGPDYIFCERQHSDEAVARAIAQVGRKYGADAIEGATVADFRAGRLYNTGRNFGTFGLQSLIHQAAGKHSYILAPRKSKTAGRVIYAGNDGCSQVGALAVE